MTTNLSIMCKTLFHDPFPGLFWYLQHMFANTKSFNKRKTTMLERNTPSNMNKMHRPMKMQDMWLV